MVSPARATQSATISPPVPGLPDLQNRTELTLSLGTKQRRLAYAASLDMQREVQAALDIAERLAQQAERERSLIFVDFETALAKISAWQARGVEEIIAPFSSCLQYRVRVKALRPDSELADRLATEAVRVSPEVLPQLRQAYADALATVKAHAEINDLHHRDRAADPADIPAAVPRSYPTVQPPGAPFLFYRDAWLKQLGSRSARGRRNAQRVVDEFAALHPGLTLTSVTRKHAREWVESMAKRGLVKHSIKRSGSYVRGYWRWLSKRDRVAADGPNPFDQIPLPENVRETPEEELRDAYDKADLTGLTMAARKRGDQPLADLIMLAAYTGARLSSICDLTVNSVRIDPSSRIRYFQFADKTSAGRRKVPVHSDISGLVDRLIAQSKDTYLIPSSGIRERSSPLRHRFGDLKTKLGYKTCHDFHSIRATVIEAFRDAGCPEAIASSIVGHKVRSMTFGVYGKRPPPLSVKLRWITTAISYPDVTPDQFPGPPALPGTLG